MVGADWKEGKGSRESEVGGNQPTKKPTSRKAKWVFEKRKRLKLRGLGESAHFECEAALQAGGRVLVEDLGLRGLVGGGGELAQARAGSSSVTFFNRGKDLLAQRADAALHGLIGRRALGGLADVFF